MAVLGSCLALWSAPNAEAIAAMSRFYAANVEFYGKPIPRAVLLVQKRTDMLRWLVRPHVARAGAMAARCDPGGTLCTASALARQTMSGC